MSRRRRGRSERPVREAVLDATIVTLSMVVGLLLVSTLWRGLTAGHKEPRSGIDHHQAAVGATSEDGGHPGPARGAAAADLAAGAGQGLSARSVPEQPIRVQVLNGCGVNGAGRKMTSVLRQMAGIDVVEIGNADTMDFEETVVVDRVGDGVVARAVARAIGDPPIVLQRKAGLSHAVTVIVGYDGGRWKGTLAGQVP